VLESVRNRGGLCAHHRRAKGEPIISAPVMVRSRAPDSCSRSARREGSWTSGTYTGLRSGRRMILDSPSTTSVWGGEWRSKQTTCMPAGREPHPVAAPIAPQPTTATRRAAKALLGRDPGDRLTGLHRVATFSSSMVDLSAERRGNLALTLSVCASISVSPSAT